MNDQPLSGDIILLASANDGKSRNRIAQMLLRRQTASYSHVAVSVGTYTAIHAMPKDGVHALRTRDLLGEPGTKRVLALRHKAIAESLDIQIRLRQRLFYYFKQKYNMTFMLRRADDASFCSELAAKAYADVGLALSHRKPKSVLPVDLESLRDRSEWTDVTSAYCPEKKASDEGPLARYLDEIFSGMDTTNRAVEDFLIQCEELLYTNELDQLVVVGRLNELHGLLGLPAYKFSLGRNTWLRHIAKGSRSRAGRG